MTSPIGHPGLFDYPDRAALGRVVPKSRIYAAGQVSRRLRDQITQQIDKIVWRKTYMLMKVCLWKFLFFSMVCKCGTATWLVSNPPTAHA